MTGTRGLSIVNRSATQNVLNDIQLGRELSDLSRQLLADKGRVLEFNAGETIFREGKKHPFVYWIVEGCVSLEMSTGGTVPKLLLTLGRGDLLGWSAMIGGDRMTSTATTTEPTRLLAFDANALGDLCRSNHEIGYHVMEHFARQLAGRLVATRLQLLDLFRHKSEAGR